MQLNNLREAAHFVTNKLLERGYEIRSAIFVNDYKNMVFTTRSPLQTNDTFFLKWEQRPFFSLGYEIDGGFPRQEKKGITINKGMYLDYVDPRQATILYANPDMVYHVSFVIFRDNSIEHTQRFNNEPVRAFPFSRLQVWAR